MREENGREVSLGHAIHENLTPMLRCEAECDPSFKQVIPYVLVEHKPSGRFFMTTRIGGEERLKGQASIGLGGHLDDGEDVVDALFRELEEEIGLAKDQMTEIILRGYINSDLNEVDSVHLGVVYHAYTDREDISCQESDKLIGGWFTIPEMREARRNGHMESWSAMCFDELLDKEAEE